MLDLLGLGKLAAGALALLAAIGAIFFAGKRAARKDQKLKAAKQKEKDHAAIASVKPSGVDDTVDRLRDGTF